MPRSAPRRLRIAVAGAGLIGRRHIDEVLDRDDCVLAAIADPSPAAAPLAQAVGAPLRAGVAELLARDRPDGVIVATPNALHLPDALACLAAGVPVLVEKPLAASAAEGEALCHAADASGVPLLVGHHRAHSPLMAAAREVLRSGRLGRIVGVLGSAMFCKPDGYFEAAPWRREPGGGPILINLIHEVHNLRMLCGEITEVQAFASNAVRGHAVEDTVAIGFAFAGGALGSFLLSDTAAAPLSWEQTSMENPDFAAYPDEDCYVIAGTDGSLAVPTLRLHLYDGREQRSWCNPFRREIMGVERADPLARQLAHFVAVLRGEAAPLVTARDGLQNLRVTEAVVAAARSGSRVAVPVFPQPQAEAAQAIT
ncbi:Gfo/Idh/MocA family protein [Derxia gummosa]|uniref:Gfo/Idh/MocA family protein n=1 Tax=Derxia gummosa DSM 723 TaxID=1121388 RepID=A0A8B6X939_9BURK|nr:Gfo/Idh/MocA family oxidoreductase [Derxia gummosa]